MEAPPVSEQQMEEVLEWIDGMTFSRPTRNLARDFSDGVLMAEVMKNQFGSLVQLHNYQPANSSAAKYVNWKTLNEKVFRKLGFQIHKHDIENIINNTPQVIEKVLHLVYCRIIMYREGTKTQPERESARRGRTDNVDYAKQLSSQLAEKDMVVKQLRETIQILETKLKKMEQLNKLKDVKIDSLMRKLDESIGL